MQRNGYDLHVSLKAEGLSVNFGNVSDGNKIKECIINIVTNRELYASVLHSYFARHAFLSRNLNQTTRHFLLGDLERTAIGARESVEGDFFGLSTGASDELYNTVCRMEAP